MKGGGVQGEPPEGASLLLGVRSHSIVTRLGLPGLGARGWAGRRLGQGSRSPVPPSDLKYGEALCTLMHTPVPTGAQGPALSGGRLQSEVPSARPSRAGAGVPVSWPPRPPGRPLPARRWGRGSTLHATSQADAEPLALLIWTRELGEDALSRGPGRSHEAPRGPAGPGPALPSPPTPSSLLLLQRGLQPPGHRLLPDMSACPSQGLCSCHSAAWNPLLMSLSVSASKSQLACPFPQRRLSRSPGLKWTPHAAPPRPSRLHFSLLYSSTTILLISIYAPVSCPSSRGR